MRGDDQAVAADAEGAGAHAMIRGWTVLAAPSALREPDHRRDEQAVAADAESAGAAPRHEREGPPLPHRVPPKS